MKLSLACLMSLATAVLADKECVGTFIFGRHNDRNAKPANILSPYGAQAQYNMGDMFRKRYFGLDASGDDVESDYKIDSLNEYGLYTVDDFYGQAPSANVILFSHLSFLQGLYPPTTITTTNDDAAVDIYAQMANGTDYLGPLHGYQYVQTYIQEEYTEDYIWIKGDVDCPSSDAAIDAWLASDDFAAINSSSYAFYQGLSDLIPSSAYTADELSFTNAASIYDFMNVNSIHNETLSAMWNESVLFEVRILADKYNFGISYNTSDKLSNATIGAQTLNGAILSHLNTTKVEQTPLINYFTGSFNTMFQWFGLTDLYKYNDNFTGIARYGSVLVFELLKENDDYYVQFLFKNGSQAPYELTPYPLFGMNETVLPWDTFVSEMQDIAITNLDDWCSACSATVDMCTVYSDTYEDAEKLENDGVSLSEVASGDYSSLDISKSKLTNAAAGGIGAGVTIGVFLIIGALAYLLAKRRSSAKAVAGADTASEEAPHTEKQASNSSMSDNTI